MTSTHWKDAAGISKEPMCLSITMPCSTNVEYICSRTVENSSIVAQIGSILIRILSSSTWVTVQILHVLRTPTDSQSDCITIAALSKNLQEKKEYYFQKYGISWLDSFLRAFYGRRNLSFNHRSTTSITVESNVFFIFSMHQLSILEFQHAQQSFCL